MMFLFALLSFALVNALPLEAVHDELLKTSRWDQEGSVSEINQLFVDDEGTTEDDLKDPEHISGADSMEPKPDLGLDHLKPEVKAGILADIRDEKHMADDEQPEDDQLAHIFNQIKIAYQPTDDEADPASHGNVFLGEPEDPEDLSSDLLPITNDPVDNETQ